MNKNVDQFPTAGTVGSSLSDTDKVLGWETETGKTIKILISELRQLLSFFTPFSALRTVASNPAIGASEIRLRYDCADGEITPAMPSPTNGRPLVFYNDGTVNNVVLSNMRLADGSIGTYALEPGNWAPIVGDGTNWRFDN